MSSSIADPRRSSGEALNEAEVIARYRNRYRLQDIFVSALDSCLSLVLRKRLQTRPPSSPARILLANAGHLGDALMSASLVPAIRHAFPDVFVGYLTGSYSRAAVETHPLLDRIHYLDHWAASRTGGSVIRQVRNYYV